MARVYCSVVVLSEGALVGGRYRLERLLGEGGMGVVWLATHAVTRKPVALKFLQGEDAQNPTVRARFLREARAASAVRHPNVVEIHDVIELEDGTPVMVMEFLDGESLGQRLEREGAVRLTDLAHVLVPVCDAVFAAHTAGVVHRDLKPDNIFIAQEGGRQVIKVLDFGIAKLTMTGEGNVTGNLTSTGAMLGTPYYMAPEQVFGERDIDRRADVWAMGIILYECLTGVRPTDGENVGQIMKVIMTGRIKPIAKVAPSLPPEVADLVDRCLQLERDKRPSAVDEVRRVLEPYTRDGVVVAPPPPRVSVHTVDTSSNPSGVDVLSATISSGERVAAGTLATSTSDTITTRRKKMARWPLIVGAVALVGAVGGVGLTKMNATPAATTTAPIPQVPQPTAPTTTILPTASVEPIISASAPATPHSAPATSAKPVVTKTTTLKPPASVTTASATTTTAPTTPGGVIDKPPF